MKYLIVKCDELTDQYECDADRTPICLTNNYQQTLSKMKGLFEVYEVLEDNNLKLIKEYY